MAIELRGLQKRPVAVTLLLFLSLTVLTLAAHELLTFARFGDISYWAQRVERNQPVDLATLSSLDGKIQALRRGYECQSQFVKAALTIRLIEIDSQSPDRDFEKWSDSLQRADEFVNHAITCLPTDGNIWLRLAMVRSAAAEQPQEVARYLHLSQLYAPAEGATVIGRYQLYNRLTPQSLDLIGIPLNSDLKILCAPMNSYLRRNLSKPGPNVVAKMNEANSGCQNDWLRG